MHGIRLLLIACLLCFAIVRDSGSQSRPVPAIAVLFPDVGEPYRGIFLKIIEGIEDRSKARAVTVAVPATPNSSELNALLHKQDIRMVVALGRYGIKASSGLDHDLKLMIGGVVNAQASDAEHTHVSSLAPDPALLFARLKLLTPQVKKVYVVYDPLQNAWLIKLAQQAAKAQGLELVAQEATDIKAALQIYQQILAKSEQKQDALWLPQDSTTVQDSVVLPLVLRSTWSNNLTVFSSNVSHVSQGVLFAMYADNFEYGRKLGQLALQANRPGGMHPLREVLMALNKSTASHLSINLSQAQLDEFQLIFPQR